MLRSARRDGRFRFLSGKRKVRVDVPEDPLLTGWLDSTPNAPPAAPRRGRKVRAGESAPAPTTLVYNVAGRPYSEDGLGQELAKLVRTLHQAGALDSDRYDLHGLRHTRGVELALAGCSDAEGAAMMGHSSASSFSQYRRQADRTRLADTAAGRVATLRERARN
jgi:integrase